MADAIRVVSCGNCRLVLTEVEMTGRSLISDGVSTMAVFKCPRCGAEVSVITRRPQVPEVDGELHLSYRVP